MPFEFKKFTEADQPKYDSLHLKNPVHTFKYPPNWVVDDENDALMIGFGGQGYRPPEDCAPPYFYALVWKDKLIKMEGYLKREFPEKGKRIVLYEMTRVVIPKELESETEFL